MTALAKAVKKFSIWMRNEGLCTNVVSHLVCKVCFKKWQNFCQVSRPRHLLFDRNSGKVEFLTKVSFFPIITFRLKKIHNYLSLYLYYLGISSLCNWLGTFTLLFCPSYMKETEWLSERHPWPLHFCAWNVYCNAEKIMSYNSKNDRIYTYFRFFISLFIK